MAENISHMMLNRKMIKGILARLGSIGLSAMLVIYLAVEDLDELSQFVQITMPILILNGVFPLVIRYSRETDPREHFFLNVMFNFLFIFFVIDDAQAMYAYLFALATALRYFKGFHLAENGKSTDAVYMREWSWRISLISLCVAYEINIFKNLEIGFFLGIASIFDIIICLSLYQNGLLGFRLPSVKAVLSDIIVRLQSIFPAIPVLLLINTNDTKISAVAAIAERSFRLISVVQNQLSLEPSFSFEKAIKLRNIGIIFCVTIIAFFLFFIQLNIVRMSMNVGYLLIGFGFFLLSFLNFLTYLMLEKEMYWRASEIAVLSFILLCLPFTSLQADVIFVVSLLTLLVGSLCRLKSSTLG